ncbi:hypothetical protein EZV62_014664 [Acer yangbiense]|uniref:Retrotransposon gag domain-containing protein n=1 Tax=Acer yangbiense TaxID=1000413 RepID=A0A5C7HST1_9ROSI|nr:hypothetical protein EZV62_014664 [Acer yangbiense]
MTETFAFLKRIHRVNRMHNHNFTMLCPEDAESAIDVYFGFIKSDTFSSCQELLGLGSARFSSSDAASAWKEKFRIQAEQGKQLEDYYRKQRKLVDFQVAGAPGETWQGLLAALHLQHMNAVSSSQKLTA